MSNPATIMIVDDSATNRMILEEMVMELGHQSVTAVNGKDGLDKIRKKMPDVLLLDIMMPIMNGYQVLEALKADPATRDYRYWSFPPSMKWKASCSASRTVLKITCPSL